jgi:hypothetical protein
MSLTTVVSPAPARSARDEAVDGVGGVMARAVEAPVDGGLHATAQRLDQTRDPQGRRGDQQVGADGQQRRRDDRDGHVDQARARSTAARR